MSEQYYIHRKGTFVGNAPSWWAKGGNGYTSYILGAERFSLEDALKLVTNGNKYAMYKCADVDARLHLVYDVQDDKRLGTDEPCGWKSGYATAPSETARLRQQLDIAVVVLNKISQPTQTENLLWWQNDSRQALAQIRELEK